MSETLSDFDRPIEYYKEIEIPTVEEYRQMLRFKDQSTALYDRRWQNAKAVIDAIAERIDQHDKGHFLYGLVNGESPLVEKLDEYFDRSGDKVKLKRRIDELESENAVLRSLIGK